MRRVLAVSGLVLAVMAPRAPVAAQSGSSAARVSLDSVPRAYQPPANMCRVWLDGVPAAQQPAPMACSEAVRTKPLNGRVVYGPAKSGGRPRGASDLPIKRFDGKADAAPPPIRLPGRPEASRAERPPWEFTRRTDD